MRWAYGITTCPQRIKTLLAQTVDSLRRGGFENPRLFVDGSYPAGLPINCAGLQVSARGEPIGAYGNWILALWELYLRDITADWYAIFQDDLVCGSGLREYLEFSLKVRDYGDGKYFNLHTFPSNQEIAPEGRSWYPSNQFGRSALGLVFNRGGVLDLLSSRLVVIHPQDAVAGKKRIDGTVIDSLRSLGYIEYVHSPSLLQHTGQKESTLQHKVQHPLATSFLGEHFNYREWIT